MDEYLRITLRSNNYIFIKELIKYARKNNKLKDLFNRNFKTVENYESTPLLFEFLYKRLKYMKLINKELGDGKININIKDDEGFTPLIYASKINDTKLFKYLYEIGGIDKDDVDNYGNNAFLYTQIRNNYEISKLLDPAITENKNIEENFLDVDDDIERDENIDEDYILIEKPKKIIKQSSIINISKNYFKNFFYSNKIEKEDSDFYFTD